MGKPFFSLSYLGGSTNQLILRNIVVDDMGEAWEMLKRQVLAQSEVGRATLQLITYEKKDNANNPSGRTNIDLLANQAAQTVAGIGQIAVGYIDEAKVSGMLAAAQEKWELQHKIRALEDRLDAPPDDWVEKVMSAIERIGETPFGAMLAQRFLGGNLPAMPMANIAGTPDASATSMDEDLEATATILGVDEELLVKKIRQLVEQNPEGAKQLFST